MKSVILAVLLTSGIYAYTNNSLAFIAKFKAPPIGSAEEAFQTRKTGIMLTAEGVVAKVLSDETEGMRHQRFILRLESGQTLLVVHNIELAPRVENLEVGSAVKLRGEYLWSDKGGRIHWTHKDPSGRHSTGWIEFAGRRYS